MGPNSGATIIRAGNAGLGEFVLALLTCLLVSMTTHAEQKNRPVNLYMNGKQAGIHFHDLLVGEFDAEISLENFLQAVNALTTLQPKG